MDGRIIPKIGNRPIDEITPKELRLLRESIMAAGKIKGGKLTNRRVNRMMQPVKAIFAELHGDIETNPAARLGRLKEKRIAEIQPFEAVEVAAIIKAIDSRYVPFVQFLFE